MNLLIILGAIWLNSQLSLARPQTSKINMTSAEAPSAPRRPQSYGSYQFEIFAKGAFGGGPVVTTDPSKLEAQARGKMTPKAYGFLAGGSGDRATMEANRLAFRQWKLIPRMLRGSGPRDLSVQLFGKKYPTPVLLAPIGFQNIFHSDAEPGVAGVANELGIPYVMSMNSNAPIEDIASANKNGERWFQLYWPPSDYMTILYLNKAKANSFNVLVVTLDAFTLGWRPWDLDQGYMPVNTPRTPRNPNTNNASMPNSTFSLDSLFSPAPSWDRLKFLRDNWSGPIVLKGIQHVDDAKAAVAAGMDGIIVSNHGGRQLDGGIGSLDALEEIAAAVGDQITVLFDSGIRTGADIIKALSLGAKAVLVGRPWAYGLGIAGKEGAKSVIRGILAQLEINMNIAGLRSIADCNKGVLRKITYLGGTQAWE
jgi:lactate 2-monooxygenase